MMKQFSKSTGKTIAEEFAIKTRNEQKREKLTHYTPVIILAALCAFFTITCPDSFFTLHNLRIIFNQLSVTLIIAIGLTFVTVIGCTDLSVDGVVALGGCVLSILILNNKNSNDLGILGVLVCIFIGALCGLISGAIHVRFKVTSFMVTYAMMAIADGVALMSYGGHFATIQDETLIRVPQISFLGIPLITWIAVAIFVIACIVQRKTAFGRHLYAIGANEAIPRITGINVSKLKVIVFMISGVCFAAAGILSALRLGYGIVDIGDGQFFPAQAAVIIGGTPLSGGKGGVLHTLVGSMIITVLDVGLLLMGVNAYIRTGVQGVIIVAAVILSVRRNGRLICK